jgi:O-antigen ligase
MTIMTAKMINWARSQGIKRTKARSPPKVSFSSKGLSLQLSAQFSKTSRAMSNSIVREKLPTPGFLVMLRDRMSRFLVIGMEATLLAMVCLSPWAYGAVHPGFEFLLDAGVGLLTLLWGLRMLLKAELTWRKCPVALGLATLFLMGLWQITPLNRHLLQLLSPSSAQWYERLLPSEPEELPFAEPGKASFPNAGLTISLYPQATRIALQRLLAVLLLFAVVRNNLGTRAAFRRLALAALLNGAILSLFALVQFFSSPPHLLYWTYSTADSSVFGPFIYRNHYACYINMCIGLALGLLWTRQADLPFQGMPHLTSPPWSERLLLPFRLLQDPAALWICVALALMLSSVIFTLSRGGFLALLGGFGFCLISKLRGSTHFLRLGAVFTSLVFAGGLLGWFGLKKIETRYATLWGGTALQESRLSLWDSTLRIVKDFPVWGTGYGTCQYVDPLYRTNAELADLAVDHLHNDHLELLVEGGMVGSAISLIIIVLVVSLAYRAMRTGYRTSGLAVGALFSFLTLVFHSLGDFCIYVPAITLLATVLCAHLCAAGSFRRGSVRHPANREIADRNQYTLKWRGVAPVLGAASLVALGWMVVSTGWTKHQTEDLRHNAFMIDEKSEGLLVKKKDFLKAAVRLNPFDAEIRTELGDVYAELFRQQNEKANLQNQALTAASTAAFLTSSNVGFAARFPSLALAQAAYRTRASAEEQRLRHQYLVPALENYLQARNLCPLLPGSHLALALHADQLIQGDSASVYRSRAQLLAPSDPTFWYYCGSQELRNGQAKNAWKSWKRCLELSDRYLMPILDRSTKFLGAEELSHEVLPDRAPLLLAAATKLYPEASAMEKRKPLLQKALRQLKADSGLLSTKDLHTKALIFRSLGEVSNAERAYRSLLEREPLQSIWRYEFAEVLYEEGQLEAARTELFTVLAHQPKHGPAFELLRKVTNDLLKRK